MTSFNLRRVAQAAGQAVAIVLLSAAALAQQPTEAQRNALRQACPADFQAHCAGVSPGGQAAFACLERNMGSLSQACRQAVAAVAGGGPAHATGSSGAMAAPPAAASGPPMTPRQELMLVRRSCGGDFRALCRGVALGGGRAIACLRAHAAELSPQCGGALRAARANR